MAATGRFACGRAARSSNTLDKFCKYRHYSPSLKTSLRSRSRARLLPVILNATSPILFSFFILVASTAPVAAQKLTHGPVVGGVTSSSANVFVRTNTSATVAVVYGTDPNLITSLTSSTFRTAGPSDFTKIIPLNGLVAETPYYLNVKVNGVSQLNAPYPTFTTFAPAGAARDFKFIVLTDFTNTADLKHPVPTFDQVAAELPAFVFIGGDFDHRGPLTLTDKRQMFKDLYSPLTRNMSNFVPHILQKFAIAHQWDDHDAGVNNADKTYTGWGIAQQVFEEYVPTYPLPAVSPGIWQKFSYAQAECFILDCRSQRTPEKRPDNADKSMLDGNEFGTLGELQWLENGLLNSSATWKVIFSSVVTNTTTKYPDGWAGYQTEWNVLRDFITNNQIKNVVFISGDLHLAAIDDGTISGFPEMCVAMPNASKRGTGFDPNAADRCSTAPEGNWSEGYYEADCSGYGRVTIQQNPDRLVLESVDEFGVTHLSYTVPSAE